MELVYSGVQYELFIDQCPYPDGARHDHVNTSCSIAKSEEICLFLADRVLVCHLVYVTASTLYLQPGKTVSIDIFGALHDRLFMMRLVLRRAPCVLCTEYAPYKCVTKS